MTEKELIEIYNHNLPIIKEVEEKRTTLLSNWIKNIVTLLVGLLSILVAFKSDKTETCFIHFLFSITLILLGVSILSGVIFLYADIERLNRHEQFEWESLRKRLGGNKEILSKTIVNKKIFKFFSWVFYISSIMSVICLVCYGIMKS